MDANQIQWQHSRPAFGQVKFCGQGKSARQRKPLEDSLLGPLYKTKQSSGVVWTLRIHYMYTMYCTVFEHVAKRRKDSVSWSGGVFSWCVEGLSDSAISSVDSQWHQARHLAVGALGKINLISTLWNSLRLSSAIYLKHFHTKVQ